MECFKHLDCLNDRNLLCHQNKSLDGLSNEQRLEDFCVGLCYNISYRTAILEYIPIIVNSWPIAIKLDFCKIVCIISHVYLPPVLQREFVL